MFEEPGTIPPANGDADLTDRDNVLHPFDTPIFEAPRYEGQRFAEPKEVLEKRGARPSFLSVVWPILIGGVLAFVAPQIMDFLMAPDQHLEWVARAVFPYVLIASRPQFRMFGEYTSQLPQFLLVAQFPLEGMLTTFNLRRRLGAGVAIGLLIVIHLVGAFVLFLLTQY
jgi:hypothetical protein